MRFHWETDVKRTGEQRRAEWAATSRQAGLRRRNWRTVRRLAGLTVVLMAAALLAEFAFGSRTLATVCGLGAGAAGITMLVWFRNTRLFVD